MADLINEGGILLLGLPRLYERGYSLTPVDISQSDHDPTEEQRTEHMNRKQKHSAAWWYRDVARPCTLLRNAKGSLTEKCFNQQIQRPLKLEIKLDCKHKP